MEETLETEPLKEKAFTSIECLPIDVWLLLPSFLYWKEWNHFLYSIQQSKQLITSQSADFAQNLKRRGIILKLNKQFSMQYYIDATFRSFIAEQVVMNITKQVSLTYEFTSAVADVSVLQGVSSIKFAFCKQLTNISSITSLKHLILYGNCDIENLSALKQLQTLDITSNDQLCEAPDIFGSISSLCLSRCNNLDNIAALGKNTNSLDLSKCIQINQVNHLGNVRILNLSGCISVTDVSSLGNVHRLDISYCSRVENVGNLGKVPYLIMRSCRLISDVTRLGQGNYFVDLSYCPGVTDVSSLASVHTVILQHCTGITNVNCLKKVYELDLTSCEQVSDVSELGYVHTLTLTKCHRIIDISKLGKANYYLDLRQCHGISDVSSLKDVYDLNLSYSTLIENIRGKLTNVKKLNISGNNYIRDVSSLKSVEVLDISFCRNISCVSMLPNLKVLIMYGCQNIFDLNELGKDVVIRAASRPNRK
eukprot:gene6848-7383_t